MKKVLLPLIAAATAALLVASMASAAAPPKFGHQCYKGAWQTIGLSTSGPFTSQSACVSYLSNGGVIYPYTPTFTATAGTAAVAGLGALVGNPQTRTAGGLADPAI